MASTYGLMVGSGWEGLAGDDTGTEVSTAFGAPSARVHRLKFGNHRVLSLARHGAGHTVPPHVINYRANVLALKKLGADAIIGLNTVGVITTVIEPGGLAIPDQLIDYTWGREHTIFDGRRGLVEHIDFTEPYCPAMRNQLLAAAGQEDDAEDEAGVGISLSFEDLLDQLHGSRPVDRWWTPPPNGSFVAAARTDPPPLRIAFSTTDFSGHPAHEDCRDAVLHAVRLPARLLHQRQACA